ncbi:MAG: hypothetical protein NTX61_15620 [Bacteroidetes bacterium]|nr:hypothetical protein [Bacteroidota bacterium]
MLKSIRNLISFCVFFFIGIAIFLVHFLVPGGEKPTSFLLQVTSLVIALIGIWMLRKILLVWFSDRITAITMVTVFMGTNYFQVSTGINPLPVVYLFTLYTLILWFTIKWHSLPTWKSAIPLGIAMGITILFNPSDFFCVLIPVFWHAYDRETFRNKWKLVKKHLLQVLVICLLVLMFVVPLITSWDLLQTTFNYTGYAQNGMLYLLGRYLWQVMFSFNNGWFIYTPVMLFSLIGFYFLAEKNKNIYYSCWIFFLVNFLFFASWSTYTYSNNLGMHGLIPSYVILSLSLGYLISHLSERKYYIRYPALVILVFFILLNLFQTWQYFNRIIDPEKMTEKYYWSIFGKVNVHLKDRMKLENFHPDPDVFLKDSAAFTRKTETFFSFEDPTVEYQAKLEKGIVKNGLMSLKLDKDKAYSPAFEKLFGEITRCDFIGVRISAWVYSKESFTSNPVSLIITTAHKSKLYNYRNLNLETLNLKPNQWNQVMLNYFSTVNPDPEDKIIAYVYYRGNTEIFIDDVKTEIFEPRY